MTTIEPSYADLTPNEEFHAAIANARQLLQRIDRVDIGNMSPVEKADLRGFVRKLKLAVNDIYHDALHTLDTEERALLPDVMKEWRIWATHHGRNADAELEYAEHIRAYSIDGVKIAETMQESLNWLRNQNLVVSAD